MKIKIAFIILLTITGCSTRSEYQSIQMHQRNECTKVPLPEYQECIQATYKTYDEYYREYNQTLNR